MKLICTHCGEMLNTLAAHGSELVKWGGRGNNWFHKCSKEHPPAILYEQHLEAENERLRLRNAALEAVLVDVHCIAVAEERGQIIPDIVRLTEAVMDAAGLQSSDHRAEK